MISISWVAIVVGFAWGSFLLYMAYGRDWVQSPLWVWFGIPATFAVVIAVGHLYFGYPIFSN